MSQRPDPAALTTQSVERTRPPRRIFALGNMQFRVSHARVCDAIMDGLSFALEGFVYLIGPLLILLALFIIGILTYTFFTILLPMLQLKYAGSSLVNVYLGLHASWVVFIVVNVLFNYFMCVTTRNKGANYDKLVRELAVATNFCYPETPVAVTQWKNDYEDRMYALMRRRQAQARNAAATIASESNGNTASASSTGMIQRRAAATAPNGTTSPTSSSSAAAAGSPASTPNQTPTAAATVVVPKPTPVVYRWMLMGPLEWGYCNNSKQPKPPRSHYDHVSTALVLNLDHYCPWMFNAIGYFNYRYFLNFLLYIFVGMLYGALVTLEPFLSLDTVLYKEQVQLQRQARKAGQELARFAPMLPFREEKLLVTLSFMLCIALTCAIFLLGGFHVYITFTGQTTIEFHANMMRKRKAKKQGKKWNNPYDQGWRRNWQHVYGTQHWMKAMLPSTREPQFLPVPIPGFKGRWREGSLAVQEENGNESAGDNIV